MNSKPPVWQNAGKWVLAAGMFLLLAGTGMYFFGEGLLWSTLRPSDEALTGDEVPRRLPAEAWREDVRYLRGELPRRTPRFGEAVDAEVFDRIADSTAVAVGRLGRTGRELALLKLANLPMKPGYGGGHTQVPVFQRPLNWGYYSFYAYPFDDGIWVTLASGDAGKAQGSRILAINGVPTEEVLRRAAPYVSADNVYSRRERLAAMLSYAGFLQGLDLVPESGELELLLRTGRGDTLSVHAEPSRVFSWSGIQWGRQLQQPVNTWSPADPRPREVNYFFEYREPEQLIYLQFNRVQNMEEESIEAFARRLEKFVDGHGINRFVVDLRANGGGNNQLLEPLISLIAGHPAINRRGVLYTLIGPRTYSAAGAFACALERRTQTLFGGEPSGFTPNHVGDAVRVPLPQSRLLVAVATRYWEDGGPFDRRRWLEPDLHVPMRAADHFAGRDPVMAAVRAHQTESGTQASPVTLPAGMAGRYRFGAWKVMEVGTDVDGKPGWTITGTDTWASSGLYVAGENRFATDLREVFLEWEDGALTVHWKGSPHRLQRMGPDDRSPLHMLKGIAASGVTVDSVVSAFREQMAEGHPPDSHAELLMNRIGYGLMGEGRDEEALRLFRLMTELYPTVANAFDSLGDALLAKGDREGAREAFRKALELDPGFDHPREMLTRMDGRE